MIRTLADEFPWWFVPGWPVFAIATLAILVNLGLVTIWPWWRKWA